MEGVCKAFESVLKEFPKRLKGDCKSFEKSLQRVCKVLTWALRRVCKEFEIVCLRVCMLIKAILVIIFIKAQYGKPFGAFLFGLGGFDNQKINVSLMSNTERDVNRGDLSYKR